ncbi:MAG: methyl-accepting chemotaxis protein [Acetatifactor sp.]|nr:methyl-accepting chemotaxis protein [Acetatifactor sp.]
MSNKISKRRIKERLTNGFLIASGIPSVVAVLVMVVLIVVAVIYSNSLRDYGFAQGDVGKALKYFSEARSALRAAIGFDDESAINDQVVSHDNYKSQFEQSFAELEQYMVSKENQEIYKRISSLLPNYWKVDSEILQLGATTDRAKCLESQDRAYSELRPLYGEIEELMMSIMDIKVERGDSISNTMTIVCILLVVAIAVVIALALMYSIRMGNGIATGIAEPLIQLADRLERFSKGDLYSAFPDVNTGDEVAEMVASAKDMAESLQFIIADTEYILDKMANADFTVSSKDSSKYVGDFRQLYESMKDLKYRIAETMHSIEESSVQVTEGSGHLAETAVSLAEGATEQAGAVQELQATITTIADAAEKAASSAKEAYHQSQKYADVADESSADMKEMVEAMNRISEASKKIGNIISEIESIASQTNLLSLNASIEAARAGEAGRGFSVVADQIRQLAEQSSKSAVDTRALIEGTMQEVENGNKVAERAVASIETVVDGIRTVAISSKDVSVIAENQSATMKEAEIGVNQISDVIQTNAALAEESSATSEELSAQASTLDSLIAKFSLPPAK